MGKMCRRTLEKYAKTFGYHCEVSNRANLTGRHPSWMRILIIKDLFNRGYDYVMWVDSDALFVNFSNDIKNEIEEKKYLYLVAHNINGENTPNLGVFLIKNCKWSIDLLDKMWSLEKYINHKWWENAAFLKILGMNRLLEEGDDQINEPIFSRVKYLDLGWNSLPGIIASETPIINHYPAISYEERIKYIEGDFQKYQNKQNKQ